MPRSTLHAPDGTRFDVERELIDVTRLRRPDEHWRYTDASGHVHQWHIARADGTTAPMETYHPSNRHVVPTLVEVVDAPETDEYPAETHLECTICRQTIHPGCTSDSTRQFIHGPVFFSINGVSVSETQFLEQARAILGIEI